MLNITVKGPQLSGMLDLADTEATVKPAAAIPAVTC
jgi:hypothetical protein